MDWAAQGMYWVTRALDWAVDGIKQVTDPRWLMHNPGWAALLGLALALMVGWLCLYMGKKDL